MKTTIILQETNLEVEVDFLAQGFESMLRKQFCLFLLIVSVYLVESVLLNSYKIPITLIKRHDRNWVVRYLVHIDRSYRNEKTTLTRNPPSYGLQIEIILSNVQNQCLSQIRDVGLFIQTQISVRYYSQYIFMYDQAKRGFSHFEINKIILFYLCLSDHVCDQMLG